MMLEARRTWLLAAVLTVSATIAYGSEVPEGEAPGVANAEPPAAVKPAPSPSVVSVVSDLPDKPDQAGLGDRITVTVDQLPLLIQEAGGCAQITLFLDGTALNGVAPERCDPDDGHVGFFLHRTEDNERVWHSLLGRPKSFTRPVAITVGSALDRSLPTAVREFRLVTLSRFWFYVFVIAIAIILLLFYRLATQSELLRNPNGSPGPGQRLPYSMARVQMAFWSLLVVAAYSLLWLLTGELDTITDSVLALLGIGSGTALGASLIDAGKRDSLAGERRSLEIEKKVLENAGERAVAKPGRLVEVNALLKDRLQPVRGSSTGSFFRDILSDAQGISIQRFQMAVWTIILGLIFCASVYNTLDMPEFSPTLLALLGISNGTYLGFKFPEQNHAKNGDQGAAETPAE